jgi:hypothetical protein
MAGIASTHVDTITTSTPAVQIHREAELDPCRKQGNELGWADLCALFGFRSHGSTVAQAASLRSSIKLLAGNPLRQVRIVALSALGSSLLSGL